MEEGMVLHCAESKDGNAYVAPPKPKANVSTKNVKKVAVQTEKAPEPRPTALPQTVPSMPQLFSSSVPCVPEAEEQEALTQLLLAWYQAGYAAGRYAMIRQRKK